jgi:hypothetical protein
MSQPVDNGIDIGRMIVGGLGFNWSPNVPPKSRPQATRFFVSTYTVVSKI